LLASATSEEEDVDNEKEEDDPSAAMIDPALDEYKSGRYSPVYFSQVKCSLT